MLYYSDIAVIKSKLYVPLGYVAGHLRFKFIREEAVGTKSDDEDARSGDDEDDEDDEDEDDDGDGDGSKSKEGVKGSKTQKSREVVASPLNDLHHISCIVKKGYLEQTIYLLLTSFLRKVSGTIVWPRPQRGVFRSPLHGRAAT